MDVELRHLRAFVTVAEEGRIGRAAIRLHQTQPSLSRQIAALEASLGVRLFDRGAQGVTLTAAGADFVVRARRALAAVDRALALARHAEDPIPLSLGFMCALGTVLAAGVARSFRAHRADVALTVAQLPPGRPVAGLRDGSFDVALLRPVADLEGYAFETLLREPVTVALAAGHALADAPVLDLGQLADEPWIVLGDDPAQPPHRTVLDQCAKHGFAPHIVHTSATLDASLAMAAAGHGVFPCPSTTPMPRESGLRLVPITDWTTTILLARRLDDDRPEVDALAEIARLLGRAAWDGAAS